MNCPHLEKTSAYHDGELAADEHAAFEIHLAGCAACTAEVAKLEVLSRFLSAATVNSQQPIANSQPLTAIRRQRLVHFAELLMGAAALVMAICGAWLAAAPNQSTTTTTPSWETAALGQSTDTVAESDNEEPLVQVLLRE